MSTVIKCCNCKKCFFEIGALSCPHCNFPILKKKLLGFNLWKQVKSIFKDKE